MRLPEAFPGAMAPPLKLDLVGGGFWELSRQTPDTFTLLVFYRGLHSATCRQYLKQASELHSELQSLGVETMTVSMDDLAAAKQASESWNLERLPVGYGLDEATARNWGLFITKEQDRVWCEPALFLVQPDRLLHSAVVCSTPLFRPDLLQLVHGIGWLIDEEVPPLGTSRAEEDVLG